MTAVLVGPGSADVTYDEDTPHTSGAEGALVLGVRNDLAVARTDADADYGAIALDVAGRVGVTSLGGSVRVDVTSLPLPAGAATDLTLGVIVGGLAAVLGELAQKLEPGGAVDTGLLQPLTNGELRASRVPAKDNYSGGEALADQVGDGTAKTFTFAAPVDLIWVRVVGDVGRADPFGGVPSAASGIYCADDEPNPVTITTAEIKVWAPAGSVISAWGYRY